MEDFRENRAGTESTGIGIVVPVFPVPGADVPLLRERNAVLVGSRSEIKYPACGSDVGRECIDLVVL